MPNRQTSSSRMNPETRFLLEKLAMTKGLWLAGIICFVLMQAAILEWQWPVTLIAFLFLLWIDVMMPESFYKFRPARPMVIYGMALLFILASFIVFFTTHTSKQLGIVWTIILGLIYAMGSWLFLAPVLRWVFERRKAKARGQSAARSEKWTAAIGQFLNSRNFVWICAGIGLICLVLMIRQAFSLDVWIDEAFSMEIIRKNFWEMLVLTTQDVHPPLYYIFLKIGVSILTFIFHGLNPIFAARLVTGIPFVVLYILCLTWIWHRFGNFCTGFSILALFGAPQLFMYTTEIRMYGFALLWITCVALTIYDLTLNYNNHLRRKELWIQLTIFSLLAAYTHYYAAVCAAFCWAILLWWMWKREKIKGVVRWAQAAGFCFIFYVPWLFVLFRQMAVVADNFWIESAGFTQIGDYFAFVFGTRFWMLLLFVGLAIFTKRSATKNEIQFEISSVLQPVFLIVFGVILSLLFRPVYIARYVFPALFVFWIGFGIFAGSVTNPRLKIVFIIGTLFCSLGTFYNEYQAMNSDRTKAIALVDTIAADTDNKPADDVVIIVNNTHLWRNLQIELNRPIYLQPEVKMEEAITEAVYSKPKTIDATIQMEDLLKRNKSVLLIGREDSDFDYYAKNTNLKVQKLSTENYGSSQGNLSIYSVRLKTDSELNQDGNNTDSSQDSSSSQTSSEADDSRQSTSSNDSSQEDENTSGQEESNQEDQDGYTSEEPGTDTGDNQTGYDEPGYEEPGITEPDQPEYDGNQNNGDDTDNGEYIPDQPVEDDGISSDDTDNSDGTSSFQPPAYIPPVYEDSSNVLD